MSFSEHVTVGTAAIVVLTILSIWASRTPDVSLTELVMALVLVLVSLLSLICVCYLVVRQLLRWRRPHWRTVFAFGAGVVGALPAGAILLSMLTH